jgi:hypothetical protein
MRQIFILISIVFIQLAKAQNNEMIEPLFLPLAFDKPDGTMLQADVEYQKSSTQRWVVYNAVESLQTYKDVSGSEVFKTLEMNTPYWVVAEDGDFVRLYQFEKLVSYNGKMILANHVDFDYGWVSKKDLLLWSKPIKISNKVQMCFKHNIKNNEPVLYFIYKFDYKSNRYLCSVNNVIIPNQEKEEKSLIWLDSNQVEVFNRFEFLDLNSYKDSYYKFNDDSILFYLSVTSEVDYNLYNKTTSKSITDSLISYYSLFNNDTIHLSESEFYSKKMTADSNSLIIKWTINQRDTILNSKINPFIIPSESEELCQRYLLLKSDSITKYFYFPNKLWQYTANSSACFSRLYLTSNNEERFSLIDNNRSVFYTYHEFEDMKKEFELFVNLKSEGKKFRKDFFVFLEDFYSRKVTYNSGGNNNHTLSKLIYEITGIETTSKILDIDINDIRDKDLVDDNKLHEIKQLIDNKFRAVIELESNNRYYVNEGLNKFYFIPKSFISI